MESVALCLFALGMLVLQIFGAVVAFYGISADEANDFPFHNKRWLRVLLVVSMLFVAAGWPVILENRMAAWLMVLVFTLGAFYFGKGIRGRA